MALSVEARTAIQLLLAAVGYRTSKWFNSPGPQRKYYKYYILVFVVAQLMGIRHGYALKELKE